MPSTKQKTSAGFSLLEVLVAATVSSIVLMMIYTAHRSIMFSVRDMAGIAEFYENVNLATRRIDRDIQCAYIHDDNDDLFLVGDASVTEPYKGSLHFVTVMKSDLYVTAAPHKHAHTSDIKEVGYFLKEDPNYPGLFFLMRREAVTYDEEKKKGGRASILLENVEDIRFEFGSGNSPDWDSRWDTETKNRFPSAVKTTLKVKNYRGQTETFSFISRLEKEL